MVIYDYDLRVYRSALYKCCLGHINVNYEIIFMSTSFLQLNPSISFNLEFPGKYQGQTQKLMN